MAMKELDDLTPRTRDVDWRESFLYYDMPKSDTFYSYRLVGGIFTTSRHWVEIQKKDGSWTKIPKDCINWNPETESATLKNGCICCEAGIGAATYYWFNVIERHAQERGDANPIRVFELPAGIMKQVQELKKLNLIKDPQGGPGRIPVSVTHPEYGVDIYFKWATSAKKGGGEWQIQKGERMPLTDDEKAYELYKLDELYSAAGWPDQERLRMDLRKNGYFDGDGGDKQESQQAQEPASRPANSTRMPANTEEASPSRAEVVSRPVVAQSAPVPATKLGAPPSTDAPAKPSCWGDYLGEVKCITCAHKQTCLANNG